MLSRGSKLLSLWTFPQALQPGAGGKGKNPTERIILQVLSFALFCVSRVSCSSLTLIDTLISLSDHAQVDFPSPAVDVLYVGPQENVCPDPQSLEPLDPGDRSEIEKLCAQASAFGYVCNQKKPYGIK